MKRTFFVISMLLLLPEFLFGEKNPEVLLRHSRQDNTVKVVIESADKMIESSNTVASLAGVEIIFPSSYELKKTKDFIFSTSGEGRKLRVILKDISDIKTYKLTSPARIVLDMKSKPPDNENKQQKDTPQQAARQKAAELPRIALKFNTIVIDPGHGGHDYGISRQEIKEKEISLAIARDFSTALQKNGGRAFLTRKTDQSLSLGERINIANSRTPDIFISLHATSENRFAVITAGAEEAAPDPSLKGYRLTSRQGRHIEKSRTLANTLAGIIKADYKTDAVRRELPLPVLTSLDTPAILIEYPITTLKFIEQKERDRLISAIIKGLASHE